MSDAGRKMDVEDVLSSIRRLVSEEARTANVDKTTQTTDTDNSEEAPQSPDPVKPAQEKLVLTSALRVSGGETVLPDTAEIERRIADIESLVLNEAAVRPNHIEPEDAPEDEISPANTPSKPAQVVSVGIVSDVPQDQEAPFSEVEAEEDDPEAKLMEALNLTSADFVQPTSNPQPTPEVEAAPMLDEAEADVPTEPEIAPTIEPDVEHLETAVNAEPEPEFEHQEMAVTAEPEPEPEHPETAITEEPALETEQQEIVVPEVPTPDIEPEPDLEPEAPPEPLITRTEHSGDNIDITAETDSYLDEHALRELVSDMVRTELQGELGDRITRNVRKLVRREIHRALASREFD